MSEVVNIDTGHEPEPEEAQDWVIKEQLVRDLVTGLTLRFRSGSYFMILSLYGDCLEFGGRDLYFAKECGMYDGGGTAVGSAACAGPSPREVK